jgi:hypothetical protein
MCTYMTDARGTSCPFCKNPMTMPVNYAKPGPPGGGGSAEQKAQQEDPAGAAERLVKGVVTYTVTDDLTVFVISSITLLVNALAVGDLAYLEEKTVQIGYDEVGWLAGHLI